MDYHLPDMVDTTTPKLGLTAGNARVTQAAQLPSSSTCGTTRDMDEGGYT